MPYFDVWVRGLGVVRTIQTSEDLHIHALTLPTGFNEGDVEVRFSDDYYGGGGNDRNVKIDWIDLNGRRTQTESYQTHSTGTYANGSCAAGYKRSEWLHCNGRFKYYGR